MEYIILEADTPKDLEAKVGAFIENEWLPQGGVQVAAIVPLSYLQSMIREEQTP